jgi:hypothetical protein
MFGLDKDFLLFVNGLICSVLVSFIFLSDSRTSDVRLVTNGQ